MLVRDIVELIHSMALPELVDKNWDNSGLQIGSMEKEVKRVLVALDVSPITVKYAIENNIDMIISHHPFFFASIKVISLDNIKGQMIEDIIKNDIIVFSAHTNLDSAENGISEILAKNLGLKNINILARNYMEKLYKIVVYVPTDNSNTVRIAMTDNGAGYIGNYSHCTFNIKGIGTFMPKEGTKPFLGKTNRLEYVDEERIESIVAEKDLKKVIESMLKAHPYEEVVYDVYDIHNSGKEYGYGRVGELEIEKRLSDVANLVKERLNCDSVKLYGNPDNIIRRVAVCGGSGIDFLDEVYSSKADVFITGDIKYHDAQLALENGISLIDASHFYTERIIIPYLKDFIESMTQNEIYVTSFNEKSIPFMTI